MARKRDMIQIQTEVISQEEWDQEIGRPGLTVVDVYPDWCGPCASMVGTLKKIKFELGDDMLNYVVARSDDIAALETFRNRSEPLWLFFGSGQLVYQLRGAHAPLLARKIVEELEKEKKVMAGGAERSVISLVCDAPAAIPVAVESAAAAADEAETAEALNARRLRSELRVRRALAPYCVLVVGAAAADRRDEILPLLESHGFTVDLEAAKTLTEEEVDELVMPPPPPPPPAPAAPVAAAASTENAAEAESGPADGDGDTPPEDGDAEGAEPKAEVEGGEEEGAGGEEGGGEKEEKEEVEEDPEVVAEREAAKEKLLEGECALLALKDSEFSESSPYRWLTLYLGHAPAPPPGAGGEAAIPPPADRGQDGGDEPPAEDGDAAEAEPESGEAEAGEGANAEEGEKEPPLSVQLRDILVEAAAAVFTPTTVAGQWAALRRHFPQLHRAPEPSASATAAATADQPPQQQRQVALVVLTGEDAAEKLAEAGFSVLHSGEGQLTEEVAGELVARLEGGESQIPALVATPVLAAAVASDGGAPLAAIANLDPLYLSDSPEQADKDAQLVFSSWGAEIGSLLAPADGADGAANAAEDGIDGAAGGAEEGIEGAEDGAEVVAAEGEAEDTAAGESAAPEDAPAEDTPATEDAPVEDAPAEETPAEAPATDEAAAE